MDKKKEIEASLETWLQKRLNPIQVVLLWLALSALFFSDFLGWQRALVIMLSGMALSLSSLVIRLFRSRVVVAIELYRKALALAMEKGLIKSRISTAAMATVVGVMLEKNLANVASQRQLWH
jgi:hypothetical protein